jgi:hypothetical protein
MIDIIGASTLLFFGQAAIRGEHPPDSPQVELPQPILRVPAAASPPANKKVQGSARLGDLSSLLQVNLRFNDVALDVDTQVRISRTDAEPANSIFRENISHGTINRKGYNV